MVTDKTIIFGIGAQKAGTTWLYEFLSKHRECHLPVKEIHYYDAVTLKDEADAVFNKRLTGLSKLIDRTIGLTGAERGRKLAQMERSFERLSMMQNTTTDDTKYLNFLLKGSEGFNVIGDITPAYCLLSRNEFARMAALSPKARFIFIMRDPIDRLWSGIRMRANKANDDQETFEKQCVGLLQYSWRDDNDKGPERSDYIWTLNELEASVPKDQVLTMFFEDMFTKESVDKLCKFIGIKTIPANTTDEVYMGRKMAFPKEHLEKTYKALADQYEGIAERFGDAMPARWRERMKLARP